ncbi:MAG TPA: histidinol phosphate phosphatase, partial [Kandleria vitulina]|nr:histidinol phosphate phosphatase [Kandleria vitulina]
MRHIDYHMHTAFSGDSEASPREHIKMAIKKGL